ncbi:hypothetical protein [Cellulomonas phragmiteti]|uniref:Alpha/beta hydrolase n=1 Tax=Cellulomonas phragmiteti TaxID=478780 RepID=A0ABQ4DLR3_9CELL|nr:hypothetical protein [Cellulomonas phragmiteti]GIG40292.1 hypothetical protein Cph01nite_20540 [Cellulomonas phragmiteti]
MQGCTRDGLRFDVRGRGVDAAPATGHGPRAVRVPTTYVSARRDPFLAPASVAATVRRVDSPFTRVDLDADHWLPEHCPADMAVLGQVRG